jgi:diazepam-binding inhibitor (GABA receptor modulating acyl-CoA-binding protein)|uniref:ACB domain-containing protein n=1 Tax=viral metagenome TaxID=1070528 RepID=A0A6C0KBG3_9ZZZZ
MEVASAFEDVLKNLKGIDTDKLNLSNDIKLGFYKYYKQATVGDCNIPEPYTIYYTAHAKWAAWKSLEGMAIEDAMKEYINYYKNYIITSV